MTRPCSTGRQSATAEQLERRSTALAAELGACFQSGATLPARLRSERCPTVLAETRRCPIGAPAARACKHLGTGHCRFVVPHAISFAGSRPVPIVVVALASVVTTAKKGLQQSHLYSHSKSRHIPKDERSAKPVAVPSKLGHLGTTVNGGVSVVPPLYKSLRTAHAASATFRLRFFHVSTCPSTKGSLTCRDKEICTAVRTPSSLLIGSKDKPKLSGERRSLVFEIYCCAHGPD